MPADWKLQKEASDNIQRMLRGEITSEQAVQFLLLPPLPCMRGLHDTCETHGQILADCKEQGLK